MRVEELATTAGVPVDTIRYYQGRGLVPPPQRKGRVGWYGTEHLARLARIRELAAHGLTLATIGRLLSGELDAADEALATALAAVPADGVPADALPADGVLADAVPDGVPADGVPADAVPADAVPTNAPFTARPGTPARGAGTSGQPTADGAPLAESSPREDRDGFGIDELARRSGIPLPLLRGLASEGLLIGRPHGGEEQFDTADVEAAAAGLRLLEAGLPLPEVMTVARAHHLAMREVAERAVVLFEDHVREPVRASEALPEEAARRLVGAFQALLPATMTLVTHHFQRTLLAVALEHIERVGDGTELAAVHDAAGQDALGQGTAAHQALGSEALGPEALGQDESVLARQGA